MAELNIGCHCSELTCNKLDFLPIQCQYCGQIFCKLHASVGTHECTFVNDPSIHPPEASVKSKEPTCQFGTCLQHDLVALTCKACNGQFCIAHKQKETHQCKGLRTATHLAEAEQQCGLHRVADHLDESALKGVSRPLHSQTIQSAKSSVRQKATATHLALFRARMQARPADRTVAGLPTSERLLLQLTLSDRLSVAVQATGGSNSMQAFYFSSASPLGKVLDFAVDLFGVKRPTDGQTLKLLRVEPEKDSSPPLDLSIPLKVAVARGDIQEGDVLTLFI